MLKSVNQWLERELGDEIEYDRLKEILDNSAQVSKGKALTSSVNIPNNLFIYIRKRLDAN